MKIEIEKKYDITNHDLKIIEEKCNFISTKKILDEYFDTDEYILFKNYYHLRQRNGNYELKIEQTNSKTQLDRSEEYETIPEINEQLKRFNIKISDVKKIVSITTHRTKYTYLYMWYEITLDIDDFELWARYEIELLIDNDSEIDGNNIIENMRNELWLNAPIFTSQWKALAAAKIQNPRAYKVLLNR